MLCPKKRRRCRQRPSNQPTVGRTVPHIFRADPHSFFGVRWPPSSQNFTSWHRQLSHHGALFGSLSLFLSSLSFLEACPIWPSDSSQISPPPLPLKKMFDFGVCSRVGSHQISKGWIWLMILFQLWMAKLVFLNFSVNFHWGKVWDAKTLKFQVIVFLPSLSKLPEYWFVRISLSRYISTEKCTWINSNLYVASAAERERNSSLTSVIKLHEKTSSLAK